MQTIKKLWARFLQRIAEANARRRELADAPTVDEIIAAVKAGQAKIDAAAARAGIL